MNTVDPNFNHESSLGEKHSCNQGYSNLWPKTTALLFHLSYSEVVDWPDDGGMVPSARQSRPKSAWAGSGKNSSRTPWWKTTTHQRCGIHVKVNTSNHWEEEIQELPSFPTCQYIFDQTLMNLAATGWALWYHLNWNEPSPWYNNRLPGALKNDHWHHRMAQRFKPMPIETWVLNLIERFADDAIHTFVVIC